MLFEKMVKNSISENAYLKKKKEKEKDWQTFKERKEIIKWVRVRTVPSSGRHVYPKNQENSGTQTITVMIIKFE